MKCIMIAAALAAIVVAMPVPASCQWPLGREGLQAAIKTEPGPTITVTGRFQIFTSPNVKAETFMLDTETGRVWIFKKNGATGLFTLERVRVEDVDPGVKSGSKASKADAANEDKGDGQ